MRLILLGSPGAGKGTQSRLIAERFNIPQIATGDMLRSAVHSGSMLGKQVKDIMDKGELVPDQLIIALVNERLQQPDCARGFLLDGYPRTTPQAEALRQTGIRLDHVIEIQVDDEDIVDRLSGRWFHPASGRTYHLLYNPPKVVGHDDITGEVLIQREDDKESTVRKRLGVYRAQTAPLIQFYSRWAKTGSVDAPHFNRVNGSGEVRQVFERILKILQSADMAVNQ